MMGLGFYWSLFLVLLWLSELIWAVMKHDDFLHEEFGGGIHE